MGLFKTSSWWVVKDNRCPCRVGSIVAKRTVCLHRGACMAATASAHPFTLTFSCLSSPVASAHSLPLPIRYLCPPVASAHQLSLPTRYICPTVASAHPLPLPIHYLCSSVASAHPLCLPTLPNAHPLPLPSRYLFPPVASAHSLPLSQCNGLYSDISYYIFLNKLRTANFPKIIKFSSVCCSKNVKQPGFGWHVQTSLLNVEK